MARGVKTGGRTKGTQNKINSEIKVAFQLLIESNLEQLKYDIAELEPEKRIQAIIQLSKFVVPNLKAVEQTFNSIESAPKINIIYPTDNFNEDEINENDVNVRFV